VQDPRSRPPPRRGHFHSARHTAQTAVAPWCEHQGTAVGLTRTAMGLTDEAPGLTPAAMSVTSAAMSVTSAAMGVHGLTTALRCAPG